MNRRALIVTKLNLKNIKVPYFVTILVLASVVIQLVIKVLLAANGADMSDQVDISIGSFFWLLPLMAAIFIPLSNFRKIINLGSRRSNFFWGSLLVYVVIAAGAALMNLLVHLSLDQMLQKSGYFDPNYSDGIVNLVEVFGWIQNGAVIAFFQQFAFILLATVFVHTLTAMQDKWYGWVTDIVLAAILSVFIPIAPLRAILIKFFEMIIFQANAFMQIAACLILSIVIYALNKPIFERKVI